MSDIDDLFNELESVQPDPELLEDPTYSDMLKEAEEVRAQEDPRPLPPAPPVVIMPPVMEEPAKPAPALVADLEQSPPPVAAKLNAATFSSLIDIEKFVESFERDYQAIQTDLVRDRSKADQIAKTFQDRVDNGTDDKADKEALVALIDTIVNSNGHRVKLLGEKAKFLAATKSTVTTLIQNNIDASGGNDDEALVDLLSQTEEYEA